MYKRQLSVCEDCVQEAFISLWNSRDEMESEAPVSYTHLDVYKRQGLPGVGCLHRVDFTRLTRLISICPIKRGPMI